MHVLPMQTFDTPQPEAFAKIGASPMRFPPIGDTRPRHWKINFDGLFTGSNDDGLGKPQRAYVYISDPGPSKRLFRAWRAVAGATPFSSPTSNA